MQVFAVPSEGAAPTVLDIARPEPGAGEILVRVKAASINGFDTAVAAGMLVGMMEHRYPVVLGKDFAGTVEALGGGVDGFAVGDRVFGVVTRNFLGDGSLGQYVAVPASIGVAHTPEGVSDEDAAALGLAGVTALMAIEAADLHDGSVVLVAGATGGVGTQVVQRAARSGATVLATARSGAAASLVESLGATEVVDHSGDVAAAVLRSHPTGVDVVVHLAGDAAALAPALADGGRFVSALLMSPEQLPLEHGTVVPVSAVPTQQALDAVAGAHADGSLRIPVDHVYPLADAAAAFAQFGTSKLGKIVVTVA
jgi:NADPH:quinone reductase-like Zn-dependent oxidoreductase